MVVTMATYPHSWDFAVKNQLKMLDNVALSVEDFLGVFAHGHREIIQTPAQELKDLLSQVAHGLVKGTLVEGWKRLRDKLKMVRQGGERNVELSCSLPEEPCRFQVRADHLRS